MLADSFDDMAESIVDSVKDPMCILDMNHNIIYMNEKGLAFSGAKLEDTIGQPYGKFSVYPHGTEHDPIQAFIEGHDTEIYYDEATKIYVKGAASLLLDANGAKAGYMVFSKDVTDMVMKQLELEQAVNSANVANKHKGEFLARMSHEIRTPMNAIMGITNITLNKIRSGATDQENLSVIEEHMRQIETSSRHLLGLLNDILDISKIEAGKIEITRERMDLVKVIETVSNIIRPRCDEKHIAFDVKMDEFGMSMFMSDELRLRQVLINLLGNAVKFTPEHGKVHFTVENLGDEGDMTSVRFTVSDSGIGIPDEAMAKIFEPFEQAASKTSRDYGGTGLGLAISSSIVELMGGRIEVESVVEEGSVFTFTVQMERTSYSAAAHMDYDAAIGKFKGKRVMIVDDIEVNRMVVAGLLEGTGVIIEEAVDGVEAVEKFSVSPDGYYDIIFMDVQMPRMDGYAASSIIRAMQGREDAFKVVIVALTANAFTDDIVRARDSGMDTHVAKPVDSDRLIEVMFEYLGRR
jgi:PAS domain S-box-containing protein